MIRLGRKKLSLCSSAIAGVLPVAIVHGVENRGKQSVLGSESEINDTSWLTLSQRNDVITEQQNKLNLAMHYVFGTPKNHTPTQKEIEQKKRAIERIDQSATDAALNIKWGYHD